MSAGWIKKVVVYHLYPRSFKDSNNDGIGDIKGIIQKLDYLNWLGVGAVWLSPVNCSPMADFGYDVSDYCNIDPIFGTLDDFKTLLQQAHSRNIKVIMDFVPNHTSDKHPWFLEAKASKKNPKRNFYIWEDPKKDGSPPNNWLSVFGGSAWEYEPKTRQYYLHSFLRQQPDLNWRNPQVRKSMYKILSFWMELGVDGFRVDAIHHLYKDRLLRDNPVNPEYNPQTDDPFDQFVPLYTKWRPEIFKEVANMCHFISRTGGKFIVTEVYGETPKLLRFYQACDKKLGSKKDDISFCPFNLQFITLPWKAKICKKFIDEYDSLLQNGELPNYVLGNHDRPRVASRIGVKQIRVAAMLLLTLRGVPFIYYGDELGMVNVPIPKEKIQDPAEKNVPGKGLGRDPARTPMQWSGEKDAGFSKHKPWLPISNNYQTVNVESESQDKYSILNLYKSLIQLRNESEVLQHGNYRSLSLGNDNIFAYTRIVGPKILLVVLNFSDKRQQTSIPQYRVGEVLLSTHLDKTAGSQLELKRLNLKGGEGYVFRI